MEYNFWNWFWTLMVSIFIELLTIGGIFLYRWKWKRAYNVDLILMMDENNRHQFVPMNATEFEYKEGKYFKEEGTGTLSKKGKSFHIFSENNPIPLKLKHKKSEWLDAKTLKTTLDNKLIKQMVQPQEKFDEFILRLGGMGGIIAGIGTLILLLIETGVLNV